MKQEFFQEKALIIVKKKISSKEYYLDSSELTNDDQKSLARSTELPSLAFMRDANAGNAFLKINTINGRLYSRLRTAIQDYQQYLKSMEKKHEKN